MNELEKAALVLLLCAPSDLNLKWARRTSGSANDHDLQEKLTEFGFSEEAKRAATDAMKNLEGKRELFADVSKALSAEFWSPRLEPHPNLEMAKQIVSKLR